MTANDDLLNIDLSFIEDDKLRDVVSQFHMEALEASKAKRYVAAVVLCGAVLEGMLTFALMRCEAEAQEIFRKKHGDKKAAERPSPADWYLSELIETASSMKLIGPTAKSGAWAVKDFRNLIHPFKLMDRSPPRWQALALGALAAIADIGPSLAGRLSAHTGSS